MIDPIYHKSRIAYLYYKEKYPGRYNEDQARKQFNQDNKIDKKILKKIFKEVYKRQIERLK